MIIKIDCTTHVVLNACTHYVLFSWRWLLTNTEQKCDANQIILLCTLEWIVELSQIVDSHHSLPRDEMSASEHGAWKKKKNIDSTTTTTYVHSSQSQK